MNACYDRLTKKHYVFRVPESETDLVRRFVPQFKLGVLKAIQQMTKVTFTRIVDLEVRAYFPISVRFKLNIMRKCVDISLMSVIILLM